MSVMSTDFESFVSLVLLIASVAFLWGNVHIHLPAPNQFRGLRWKTISRCTTCSMLCTHGWVMPNGWWSPDGKGIGLSHGPKHCFSDVTTWTSSGGHGGPGKEIPITTPKAVSNLPCTPTFANYSIKTFANCSITCGIWSMQIVDAYELSQATVCVFQ